MQYILSILSLVFFLCVYAIFVRLAARIIRASGVEWGKAFRFAALVVGLSMLGRVFWSFVGPPPFLVAVLIGLAFHLGLGAWFFSARAFTADGQPLGWRGGAKLAAVVLGFLTLFIFVLVGIVRTLFSMAQSS